MLKSSLLISIDRLSAKRPCDNAFEFRTFTTNSSLIGQKSDTLFVTGEGREGKKESSFKRKVYDNIVIKNPQT